MGSSQGVPFRIVCVLSILVEVSASAASCHERSFYIWSFQVGSVTDLSIVCLCSGVLSVVALKLLQYAVLSASLG